MSVNNVALIYDDTLRPETTGGYCRTALDPLVNVTHLRPEDLPQSRALEYDLFLYVDDGLNYELSNNLRPSAYWAIDTHLDFERSVRRAAKVDYTFSAQRDGAEKLRAAGIDSAVWLPLACDPDVHGRHDVGIEYDVCFVGNVFPGPRQNLINLLRQKFPSMFVGNRYFRDMARTHSASRIVFNKSIRNDVNMRVFEALASGSLLVTNDLSENGQAELFRDGMHLATYSGEDELVDKIEYYLRRDEVRERIAAAGAAEVLERHTYRHRMQVILETVERSATKVGRGSTQPRVEADDESAAGRESDDRDTPWQVTDRSYFMFDRPEVLQLVPSSARRVLEIGCGAGRLGAAIRDRQGAHVTGVEMDNVAADAARSRLDAVYCCDIELMQEQFGESEFDCIILADVLEHLRDPVKVLRQAQRWLDSSGAIIASIPNARHYSVVSGLLSGNWTYESAGLLDRTHLQFWTRRDLQTLFHDCGYGVRQIAAVGDAALDEWRNQPNQTSVRIAGLAVDGLPPEEAEEFFVYQWLIEASPSQADGRQVSRQQPGHATHPPGGTPTSDFLPNVAVASSSTRPPKVISRPLSILYVADFNSPGKSEQYAARALTSIGHSVETLHDEDVFSADQLLNILQEGSYDCLLFYKGCLGARTVQERLHPDGHAIAKVLSESPVPGYTWYFDRVSNYEIDPSREVWMKTVAPLCRVAFVTDGSLADADWARFHVLRQGVCHENVKPVRIAEADRRDVAFIGQVYGERETELAPVRDRFKVDVLAGVFDESLNETLRSYRIILGPRFPSVDHYWSNRIYVVLGHGGFFLAPEIEGMRQEGFVPGLHYAPLGTNPADDVGHWLSWASERERIARAGQELVLQRFTYEQRAQELVRIIQETL